MRPNPTMNVRSFEFPHLQYLELSIQHHQTGTKFPLVSLFVCLFELTVKAQQCLCLEVDGAYNCFGPVQKTSSCTFLD
jgi:hypothetical protein